jgi:DNA-binding transcriptional LysR family regulator
MPVHHAESCYQEQALVRERGLLEQTLALVPTPQSVFPRGSQPSRRTCCSRAESRSVFAACFIDAGIELDLGHVLEVKQAAEPCRWAEVNAALMLHDAARAGRGSGVPRRWGLNTPELAAHIVRFLKEPTSRTYITTYHAGHELCRSYVAGIRSASAGC